MNNDYLLLITLFSVGFAGGFSHCITMCSPFVFIQIESNVSKIKIGDYDQVTKIKNLALIYYHLGRITTYSLLGIIFSLFGRLIAKIILLKYLAIFLLITTAFFFFYQLLNINSNKFAKLLLLQINNLLKLIKNILKTLLFSLQIKFLKNKN